MSSSPFSTKTYGHRLRVMEPAAQPSTWVQAGIPSPVSPHCWKQHSWGLGCDQSTNGRVTEQPLSQPVKQQHKQTSLELPIVMPQYGRGAKAPSVIVLLGIVLRPSVGSAAAMGANEASVECETSGECHTNRTQLVTGKVN